MAVDFSCLLFVASGVVIFTMVCCSAPGCANHSDKSPDGVSFHSFPLSDPERLAKWLSLMRREGFIPRPSSEHFEEDCFEPGFLLKREFVRGDGSYARKPKRTLKATAIPTRLLIPTAFRVATLAQCQLGRGEEKSVSVKRYLFVLSWQSE